MKTKKVTSPKKIALSKGSAKSIGGIISGKKKIVLSRKQKIATVLVAALAVVGVGFGVYNYTYMNESFAASCVSNTFGLNRGGSTSCIKNIQKIVNKSNVGTDVAVSGVFNKATESLVIKFQKSHSLSGDGVVGRQTWNKLCMSAAKVAQYEYKSSGCTNSGYNFKTVFSRSGLLSVYMCKHTDTIFSSKAKNLSYRTMYYPSIENTTVWRAGYPSGIRLADKLLAGKLTSASQSPTTDIRDGVKDVTVMWASTGHETKLGSFTLKISSLPKCYS